AELELAHKTFTPHLTLVQLMASRYQAFRYRDPTTVLALVRHIQRCAAATKQMSGHPLAREARFSLIIFGFRLLQGSRLDGLVDYELRNALYKMAFAWCAVSPQWTFGSNYLGPHGDAADDRVPRGAQARRGPGQLPDHQLPVFLCHCQSNPCHSDCLTEQRTSWTKCAV
ncbi:phosphatidylinositol-4- kinase, partial [Tilletia horrida]